MAKFYKGNLVLASTESIILDGVPINSFSTDPTLSEDSDTISSSQKAVKAYVDTGLAGLSQNRISQLNSKVEVLDTGVGSINFNVDNSSVSNITVLGLQLSSGARINEFSNDTTLVGSSSVAVPTEYAVKSYIDAGLAGLSQNKISQLDSKVEVIDTGTGTVTIATDNINKVIISGTDIRFGVGTVTYPTTPIGAYANLIFKGVNEMRMCMNDGNGNFNQYLNSYFDGTVSKYLIAATPACNFKMSTGTFGFYTAPAGVNAGDTITWNTALTIDTSGNTIIGKDLGVTGNLTITGDLTVQGNNFIANTQTVLVEDNLLVINSNEVGAGVTAGTAGIEVERGSVTNYQFLFDEPQDNFRIGMAGSLQAVATREDTPNANGLAFWNSGSVRLDTNSTLTFASSILSSPYLKATGTTKTAASLYAGATAPDGVTQLNYDGYFYATRVYNAYLNDIADFQKVIGEQIPGKCYYDTLEGAKVCFASCQKSVIGILSDTFGIAAGARNDIDYAPFAVAGWVLAFVDGQCEPGDALTNNSNGNLVKMTKEEKIEYPERIIATYKKPETTEFWGPNNEIKVNNRHWVRVR